MFPKFAFPLQGHVITSDDDDAIVGNDKSTRNQGLAVREAAERWALNGCCRFNRLVCPLHAPTTPA